MSAKESVGFSKSGAAINVKSPVSALIANSAESGLVAGFVTISYRTAFVAFTVTTVVEFSGIVISESDIIGNTEAASTGPATANAPTSTIEATIFRSDLPRNGFLELLIYSPWYEVYSTVLCISNTSVVYTQQASTG